MNNDTIHVDPHIIHYTVHITDMYNENIITKRNMTETQFSPNIQDLCPMYQVSAWNAGGEGELSAPVQEWSTQAVFTVLTLSQRCRKDFLIGGAQYVFVVQDI